MIYADNAATTQLSRTAFSAMEPYLLENYGNASQPYSFARKAKNALWEARNTIAACIHALPEEIYFTSGGTESDNWAIKSAGAWDEKYGVLTSAFEHHAILHACEAVRQQGRTVRYVQPGKDGVVSPEALAQCIQSQPQTRLVSIMTANNEIGTVQPIQALCETAHKYGALFHTDAVQAVGHIPCSVTEWGVDMLSASAHKFNGPKGIGFLYVRKGTELRPFMDGGAQESGMRAGTENVAAIVGMAAALRENCVQMEDNTVKLRRLEEIIIGCLDSAGVDYRRNGAEPHIPGNMSLSFRGAEGEMLLHRLDLMGIAVSTGSACDSQRTQLSHVLQAIRLDEAYAYGTIRVSLGKYNGEEDAYKIGAAVCKILGYSVSG